MFIKIYRAKMIMSKNIGTILVKGEKRDILGLVRGSHTFLEVIVDSQPSLIVEPDRKAVTVTDQKGQQRTHQAEIGSFGDRKKTGYARYDTGREGHQSYTAIFYDIS